MATLRLEFARVTAIAIGLADVITPQVKRLLYGPIIALIGSDLKLWADVVLETAVGIACISVAWYIQTVISMYYSALRGGRMFADGLFEFLNQVGWVKWLKKCPGVDLDEDGRLDTDYTYLDEVAMYAIAGAGMYFQFTSGFSLPFPINVILMPVSMLETYLKVQIAAAALQGGSSGGAAAAGG